ncbi:hypothetical protein ALC56_10945 [Trachymyrmex septentrionalis]|uniref:Uncharacterized protein n=1 Tax=Trachymyrmex septentrionalis TaxID=34720 RepID=A0A195F1W4_9HYME|nr:hypothetical protein ALC56_10945 [Trachymyrmex septentrionalis]
METMEKGDGHLQNGSSAKMPNRLKLVLSDENDKVTSEKTAEMDPYRELELYLAKVKHNKIDHRPYRSPSLIANGEACRDKLAAMSTITNFRNES